MLQLDHICKSYTTGTFTQIALDNVSLAFRDNEFVSILGPSGSGKTTLLNVVGGLDHFDSGDLLIDGISTKEYKDRDWDTYRNNRIGFVFQSYNLIPHQTVLSNVELALTLSGVSPAERKQRARKALEDVGLGDHVDKRPSQLSGGQMQRVAIARALINDPEILLADEPTGALDSTTSVQVMDLLRQVASDRLVIMVTHNPDLAREYSTRIVELADGRIRSDTNPFVPNAADMRSAKPPRLTSMSFLTALALSFNNLMTKKGRTIMTAFAGSIGIIGIAAILALANGVNAYIAEVEEDTLSVYPLQITSSGFDITSMMVDARGEMSNDDAPSQDGSTTEVVLIKEQRTVGRVFGSVGKNDLATLKEYLDDNGGGINDYVQDIEYLYGVIPQIFTIEKDGDVRQVNPDNTFASLGIGGSTSAVFSSAASRFSTNVFSELPSDLSLLQSQYYVKAGRWPKSRDELVVVLSMNGKVIDFVSYALGLREYSELEDMVRKFSEQEEYQAPTDERSYTYKQLMARTFRVVPASQFYEYEPDFNVWTSKQTDEEYIKQLVGNAQELRIVGVVSPKEDVEATTITQGIYYTSDLTKWLMQQAADSTIVKEQLANPSINVMSGKSFDAEAKERRSDIDMGSLFSIDQSKLANAFKIDASALNLSGLDLSGMSGAMDLSGMDLSTIDMPQLDLSQINLSDLSGLQFDFSDLDLSGINMDELLTPEVMASLMPYFSNVDAAGILDGVTPTIDYGAVQQAVVAVVAGLPQYLQDNPPDLQNPQSVYAAVSEYMAQPQVRATLMEGMVKAVSFDQANREKLAANLRAQMKTAYDDLSDEERASMDKATEEVAAKLAGQVADQLSEKLAGQIQEQLATTLGQALGSMLQSFLAQAMGTYMTGMASALQTQLSGALGESMSGMFSSLDFANMFSLDKDSFADAFKMNMDQQQLTELLTTLMTTERTSYENNLAKLGYASEKKPTEIDIYPISFDAKAEVTRILDEYNDARRQEGDEGKAITYTDIVGALMSSVTDIVNMISTVLIAFVAISLVVSSIMIGVITYISVLERKKEIGILRSIGASKRDISRVFNAETVIEGLVSGLMGVIITALACIPANIIVENIFGVHRVARLPFMAALVLVGVSVFLSFVAGLIPSSKAAKADPVEALRSE